jgi:CRISPR/Cas system CMR-associated protein Cmr5 small subunit
MQEPFYKALEEVYIQMYESMITTGKIIYVENERLLSISTGDDGVKVFQLSKDLLNEDFRVFIKRENSSENLKSQANQMLLTFLEQGLIDDKTFANLFNRAEPQQVVNGLRQYTAAKIEAQREMSKQQEAMMEEQAIQEEADMALAKDEQVEAEQRQMQRDMEMESMKAANRESEKVIDAVVKSKAQ